ncbi:hypothetical protein OHB54_02340 [Streptomyces sp. NBC_01007]|nr:hypothetical protein OHB54_02340 [Streptomyces sp. NBC_01007]
MDFVFPAGYEDGCQAQQAAQQIPHDLQTRMACMTCMICCG